MLTVPNLRTVVFSKYERININLSQSGWLRLWMAEIQKNVYSVFMTDFKKKTPIHLLTTTYNSSYLSSVISVL